MVRDLASGFNCIRTLLRPPVAHLAHPPDVPCPLTQPNAPLPAWVAADPLVQKYRALIGDLPWAQFPERSTARPWPGPTPDPRAPFAAAYLVKLHEGKRFMSDLRAFLIEHPALVYWLGFARVPDAMAPHGFDVAQTVPKRRHLSTVLRTLSSPALQFLLSASVQRLRATLPPDQQASFGDTIAGDTQALLAWVKQNNPKQFITEGRLDKTRQPTGDPDCKLGVKKSCNSAPADADGDAPPAPTADAVPASRLQVGVDILWGYASGIVVTRMPDGTEVVLAERTRPFNESDPSYFHPLMAQVEQRLGRKPRYGAWDTAFDAHYVYDYFDQAGGFAAVPSNPGRKGSGRQFAPDGTPLCAARLPMTLEFSYQHRTALVPHQREKYRCPLLFPTATGAACPIGDAHFANAGCTSTIAAGAGSRLRHTLDRESAAYQQLYAQRTMVERINSQAEALDILHPKLRRGSAIANRNTLTYVLINLRALSRLRAAAQEGRPVAEPLTLPA
ncbi:MAG TPA: transposase [Roseiflexaceae bacterium]|nr:transposase [Roseiflexaceae bacterium]